MKQRPYKPGDELAIAEGLGFLRAALACFKQAGAPKTIRRVRLAISSAKGAERHVDTLKFLSQYPRPFIDRIELVGDVGARNEP